LLKSLPHIPTNLKAIVFKEIKKILNFISQPFSDINVKSYEQLKVKW